MKTRFGRLAALLMCIALLALPAAAQDDPWEIIGDVDGDGIVGPTDIQHVINQALGITDRGPDAVNLPLRQYVVASPRAALLLIPGTNPERPGECSTVGAAENFPRPNGRLLVRQGTGIAFRFDRGTQGVWFKHACGLIRSELVVESRRIVPEGEEPPPWHLIGREGSQGAGCGPRITTTHVGVRHVFERPGDFLVRCTVRTLALPHVRGENGEPRPAECGLSRALSEVLVHVRVVEREPENPDFEWQDAGDAESIGRRFGGYLEEELGDDIEIPE